MGGRRPASVEKVVGKSKKVTERKKSFFRAVKSEKTDNIVSSAIDLFGSSDEAVHNLYQATKFLNFISKNKHKKAEIYDKRKEEATKKWAEIKKKEKLKTSSEIDRILVESATKVIRRGVK
jgi:hypothetical protein